MGQIVEPKISSLLERKKLRQKNLEAYNTKLMQWFIIIDFLWRLIKLICILDFISYVSNLDLYSDMWNKFEYLYQDTSFIEQDIIHIQLSNKIALNFKNMAYFANSLK